MDATEKESLQQKLAAAIRLSRWREHVPFTVPLSLVGSLLAIEAGGADVDWRAFAVIVANIFSMSFAFAINDIADAPDDALNPQKMRRNVISSGVLSAREGWFMAALSFTCALLLFALSGAWALAIGGATLILCFLYSAQPFRLKARPVTDVLSHALMLSGLLMMTGYFAYDTDPEVAWLVILAVILFSAYGQFYNQIDDYDVDKSAGLQNTVVLLGKPLTRLLSFASLLGALVCMAVTILSGLFPPWLGTFLIIGFLVVVMFPWELDMRGNLAADGGNVQRPGLIVANLIAMVWLASAMGALSIG